MKCRSNVIVSCIVLILGTMTFSSCKTSESQDSELQGGIIKKNKIHREIVESDFSVGTYVYLYEGSYGKLVGKYNNGDFTFKKSGVEPFRVKTTSLALLAGCAQKSTFCVGDTVYYSRSKGKIIGVFLNNDIMFKRSGVVPFRLNRNDVSIDQ